LLGTVVELHITADHERVAAAMERSALAEIERLERIFNVYDESSEISRFKRGECHPGWELEEVMGLGDHWYRLSDGAFDPYVGPLRETWALAAAASRRPTERELASARRGRRLTGLDLNGIAKGWIVDRAAAAAMALQGSRQITVNGGGDIRHTGPDILRVGIEDPQRPYDNAAPLTVVALDGGAIATSGGARRGWTIGSRWYSHVIDPRTGIPTGSVAQVSVLAGSACTTDVLATALTVLAHDERQDFLARLDEPVGYLIVRSDGETVRNSLWKEREIS
jgi:thiamine biosynthesis lipoprotein